MPTLTPDDSQSFQEVDCRRCATTVLVRKSTPTQTTIQWVGDAGATCTELAHQRAAGIATARVARCDALRESIDQAVRDGSLPVLDP